MIDDLHAHIAGLRRYAFVLCRNDTEADDLVQDTLTKAIAAAATYRPERSLRTWLFGILHNTFISDRRQYAQLFDGVDAVVELNASRAFQARPRRPAGNVEDVPDSVDELHIRARTRLHISEEVEDSHL